MGERHKVVSPLQKVCIVAFLNPAEGPPRARIFICDCSNHFLDDTSLF